MVVGSSPGSSAVHGSAGSTGASSPAASQAGVPSSSSTGTAPASARARRVVPRVQPAHHCRSAVVPGPNRRNHRSARSRAASSSSIPSTPPGSQSSIAAQVYWPLIQVPVGRVRTMTPSNPSWSSTLVCAATDASFGDPRPRTTFSVSAGTRRPSSREVIGPCSCRVRSASAVASASHCSGCWKPLSDRYFRFRRRSAAATLRVAAACTVRTTSGVPTQSVRRIAWCRTSVRSSYSARSTAASEGVRIRTSADR